MPLLTSVTCSATQNEPFPGESPYKSCVRHLERSQCWCVTTLTASLLVIRDTVFMEKVDLVKFSIPLQLNLLRGS